MGARVVLDLDPVTEAHWRGWANEYLSHPADATRLVVEKFPGMVPIIAAQLGISAPPQPPATNGQNLGIIQFNGARFETQGVDGGTWCFANLQIPERFPTGKTANISFSEYIDPVRFKFVTLSKYRGDFGAVWPALGLGISGNLPVVFGEQRQGFTTIYQNESWYINIRHTFEDGRPTAHAGESANFAITAGIPT